MRNGTIIYLMGFAGSGKLTIALAIQAKFDCMLVDNHRINNVIFTLLDADGNSKLPDRVWRNVAMVRSAMFDTIRHLTKPGHSISFTNELLEGDARAHKLFMEVAELAHDRNAFFLPVRLTISPAELSRRVSSPGRAEQFKETDPEAALKKAQEREVLRPQGADILRSISRLCQRKKWRKGSCSRQRADQGGLPDSLLEFSSPGLTL